MAAVLVPDTLWGLIEPLFPKPLPRPQGGPPRLTNRACLNGIIFVLRSGIPLADAVKKTGLRLLHDLLAAVALVAAGRKLGLNPFCIAGLAFTRWPDRLVTCCYRQRFRARSLWGLLTVPNPTDRAKRGSKRHLICDGQGIPLAIKLTGANCHDSTQALSLLGGIPPLQGPRGRPRCRPDSVLGDRAYDAESICCALCSRQIVPPLAMRNTKHGSGLGRWRWVAERTVAWLNQFHRLRVRYERRPDTHLAFLTLACILICWKFLPTRPPRCPVSPHPHRLH
jgi:transposase